MSLNGPIFFKSLEKSAYLEKTLAFIVVVEKNAPLFERFF